MSIASWELPLPINDQRFAKRTFNLLFFGFPGLAQLEQGNFVFELMQF
jgi:hypothetical protein